MQIIKPKYSYMDCLKIYEMEKSKSNYNVKNPVVWVLILLNVIHIFIGAFFVHIHWTYSKDILLDIIKESVSMIGEGRAWMLVIVTIFIMPILVFVLTIKILGLIPSGIKNTLVNKGKLKLNMLKNNEDFDELKKVYNNIQSLVELPMAYLEESDYYKTDFGLEICLKKGCYITRINLDLRKYKRIICKEDSIDFTVLDRKLENILMKNNIKIT